MDIDKSLLTSLLVMADIIEARDPYTGGHVWRVSQFAKLLATKVGLSEEQIIAHSIAAYTHDIGKIGIPDDILRKPQKLTSSEFEVIKTHPSIGSRLLDRHPLGELVSSAAREHHERIDGKGYPNGLRGEQLPLSSRIICIADSFDAMTSKRPYRTEMSIQQALDQLRDGAGTQFDTDLVDHMHRLGEAGDLGHIIGHSANEIPTVVCPQCGPIIAIPRNTKDGDIIYCRACHGQMELHRLGDTFEAQMTGMTDDPRNLEPRVNQDGIDDLLSSIGS